jgi:hypothetical protein
MKLPVRAGMPTEAAAEFLVRSRRRWNAEAVVADYAQVSDVALRRLAEMAEVDRVTSAGDMGIYPMSAAPLAYSFDHFTHIRADLFRPRGPLAGPAPPSDNLRLGSVLDWIAAALPQQNAAAAEACRFELQVTGPGARIISFGTGQAMATVISDAFSFIRWVTQRGSWKELGVQAAGDKPALAAARNLKVF